jgi:hypothetical protein
LWIATSFVGPQGQKTPVLQEIRNESVIPVRSFSKTPLQGRPQAHAPLAQLGMARP